MRYLLLCSICCYKYEGEISTSTMDATVSSHTQPSEDLFLLCVRLLFYEPLKYVTQFLSTLLVNLVKYPSARSCAKFCSKFLFLTLNTLSVLE